MHAYIDWSTRCSGYSLLATSYLVDAWVLHLPPSDADLTRSQKVQLRFSSLKGLWGYLCLVHGAWPHLTVDRRLVHVSNNVVLYIWPLHAVWPFRLTCIGLLIGSKGYRQLTLIAEILKKGTKQR